LEKARSNVALMKRETVRECLIDVGPTDCVLFMERKSVDVIKAKRAAHVEHGRDRKEITGCLGLHNSTVSCILKGKC
jgi:hypothetical protein